MIQNNDTGSEWDARFKDMKSHVEKCRNDSVPLTFSQNRKLGLWASRQRQHYKKLLNSEKTPMTEERVRLLNNIGFEWDASGSIWETRFDELKEFVEEFGHSRVPLRYPRNRPLGTW